MTPGSYRIGPHTGRLLLRTYREGLAAKAGHDLVIEAAEWDGRVDVPADPATQPDIEVRVDLRSLRVVEGIGGVKPLSDGDRRQIEQTIAKVLPLDRHPFATFTSAAVRVDGDRATVDGQLALAGQAHPLRLEVRQREDGTLVATTAVVQSQWGIKPYSGFFGTLKLRDAVDVEATVALTAS